MKSQSMITKPFIFIFCFILLLSSCTDNTQDIVHLEEGLESRSLDNNYKYSYQTEEANILDISKEKGIEVNDEDEDLILRIEFQTDFYVSDEVRNSDKLNAHLEENREELDGVLLHYENSKLVKITTVVDGLAVEPECHPNCSGDYPLMNECSYAGIQDCVQHAIYEEWSTVQALYCSFTGGLTCIALEAASCIESNC